MQETRLLLDVNSWGRKGLTLTMTLTLEAENGVVRGFVGVFFIFTALTTYFVFYCRLQYLSLLQDVSRWVQDHHSCALPYHISHAYPMFDHVINVSILWWMQVLQRGITWLSIFTVIKMVECACRSVFFLLAGPYQLWPMLSWCCALATWSVCSLQDVVFWLCTLRSWSALEWNVCCKTEVPCKSAAMKRQHVNRV